MAKLVEWSVPDTKDIETLYSYMLKQGHIKKPKPLKDIIWLRCKRCGDRIHSSYSGEYVVCKCGKIGIDQTHDYVRYMGNKNDYESMNNEDSDSVKTL